MFRDPDRAENQEVNRVGTIVAATITRSPLSCRDRRDGKDLDVRGIQVNNVLARKGSIESLGETNNSPWSFILCARGRMACGRTQRKAFVRVSFAGP